MVSSVIGFDEIPSLSSDKHLPTSNSSTINESSNNDKISMLFQKCRPKNDVNLNNLTACNTLTQSPPTSSLSSESSPNKSPNISRNPFKYSTNGNNVLAEKKVSGHYVYFMNNQTRNQEIMFPNIDGVQKYSLKRPAHNSKNNFYQYNQNPFMKETDHNIWERNNHSTFSNNSNTMLSSPDLIEIETKTNNQKLNQPNFTRVGRSPINFEELSSQSINENPTNLNIKTENVIAVGEVLVFDDIGDEEWERKSNLDEVQNDYNLKYLSTDITSKTNIGEQDYFNNIEVKKNDFAQTMSGIIEYDGSPRKFGQLNQLETSINSNLRNFNVLCPPRPGFPQRINSSNSELLTKTVNQLSADDTSNDVSEICTTSEFTLSESKKSTFDYLYEFSETRKVLEEFFKNPGKDDDKTLEKLSDFNGSDDSINIHYEFRDQPDRESESYIGQRLAKSPHDEFEMKHSPKINSLLTYQNENRELNDFDLFLDSASRSSGELGENDEKNNGSRRHSRCFPYSPETTDYDSNCGDLDSEVSLRLIGSEFGLSGEFNSASSYTGACVKFYTSMPVLEDGLSSGHASDTENNNNNNNSHNINNNQPISILIENSINEEQNNHNTIEDSEDCYYKSENPIKGSPNSPENDLVVHLTPPPPAPQPHRKTDTATFDPSADVQAALMDIRSTLQRTKTLSTQKEKDAIPESIKSPVKSMSPVWVPRCIEETSDSMESIVQPLKNLSADEDDADTDLETDRLLGHQRLDDVGFYDEKSWCDKKPRSLLTTSLTKLSPKMQQTKNGGGSLIRQGLNSLLPLSSESSLSTIKTSNNLLDMKAQPLSSPDHNDTSHNNKIFNASPTLDNNSLSGSTKSNKDSEKTKETKSKEVLIEGVLFRARYLGSTQLVCEGQPTKSTRMMQAEEAVSRIKALSPDGETQPSTEVDLFISTEKIMVLNTDLKEIMMDHALRTISYIADIGDLVVLMARRRFVPQELDENAKSNRTPKMICHVFESEEAQFIAQSIGQAFQVAYMEFLKANGIEDHSFVKEMDYQEVLNSQEIFGDELEIFAKKELQKEVVVPKAKGEILGVVIVESGWGSMLPTVVIANLLSSGAAARCGQLNIGDQIIAINGLSLVGLPLSTCQTYIKNTKNQTVVKFTVVPCAPVVEVKIKRPNTKYQLGFSVQNGVICSLLRGGIAERGGVRVGHRIIEINNQSVVAVPHEKIVNLLATSVGEILMKTMPTSMFRLLTGQENPIYI